MRMTIPRCVTCRANTLNDNPQKGVNPDQTKYSQYNLGFRLGCPKQHFLSIKKGKKIQIWVYQIVK